MKINTKRQAGNFPQNRQDPQSNPNTREDEAMFEEFSNPTSIYICPIAMFRRTDSEGIDGITANPLDR